MTTFHIMTPEFTGLTNKNTGDVAGDIQFVLMSMKNCTGASNRDCMENTVLEAQPVAVDTNYGGYKLCNLDNRTGEYVCCNGKGKAAEPPCKPTSTCLVGREEKANEPSKGKYGGYWYSFTACGRGRSWNETGKPKRIHTSCLGDAWRAAAGNCKQCPGHHLDDCVKQCVEEKLSITKLENIWFKVIVEGQCPDAPPAPTVAPSRARKPEDDEE